jgi:DHA1 family bicyclomycin/chloramphenicol resistance-like MFS transporter
MSRSNFSAQQQNNQQAVLTPVVSGTEQVVIENHPPSSWIRVHHVLILGGLTALGPLSTDLYLPALPSVSRDLGATMSLTQLTLTACILGLSLGQLISGPISDAWGRRLPLLIGLALYALTSLLCLVAPSVGVLSILRFVQGVAGAAGIVIALAMARDLYAGTALARCISLLMIVNFLAPMLAPVLGGQLLAFTSWHGIFVALAGVGAVSLLAVTFGLRETLEASRRQSGGLSASLSTFRALLADRRFVGYSLSCGFAFAAGIVYLSASSFVFQNSYGLSPQIISYIFGINSLGLVVMAQVGARIVGQVSPQKLLNWGVVIIALAGTTLLVVVLSGLGLIGVLLPLFVLVASLGLIAPNATALALANVNPQIAGSASALLGVLQFSIGALVAPLVGIGGTATTVLMAAFIATFGIAALVTFIIFCRPAQAQ